jgi:hypothetical protein
MRSGPTPALSLHKQKHTLPQHTAESLPIPQLDSSPATRSKMSKVKLLSSDTQMFEVDDEVAFLSQTVKNLVEDAGMEDAVPLPNVSGRILAKIIEYCKFHVEAAKKGADDKPAKTEEEVKHWDEEFVKVDQSTLFDLILVRA